MVFFSPYTGFYNGIYGTCLYLCVNQTQIAVFIFISAWLIGKESIFIVVIFKAAIIAPRRRFLLLVTQTTA